ncbi:hypothetical protein I302_108747 [Kwoniella bestiolae CBS 10118]|uniref:Actin-like ATPase domain-containing protein n=1 Tax=Kwoniella bestiolae CBS 10118 TaxID=1296100 RepID=A0A1B9FTZ1_9TREE|nr:hypothetical protein I302_07884 [Kwoniella bestiolae CBS 10118]OCF22239.1 hypothetical protein I302_07884 [Kwoniella bestiolae CBS 10118]
MSDSNTGLVPGPSTGPLTTPTKRAAFAASADAGPSRVRLAGASPAYSSRRHSLYGIEDRVVIDPGSRVWKVGFSGEPDPRSVFHSLDSKDVEETRATEAWDLDLSLMGGVNGDRVEGDRLVGVRVVKKLREAYVKYLMTDSKARKVIILENTYLPIAVKEHIARALFDNLHVPSVSFTPSSLLALVACGRITGLVVDVGWLESTITPVYHSRPLYMLSRSTPLAGRKLHRHLRTLLHHHAIYIPPPSSLGNIHDRPRTKGLPMDVLSDEFIERVLTESCFVGNIHLNSVVEEEDQRMDIDEPSTEESESSRIAQEWEKRYADSSTAKDLSFRIPSRSGFGPTTIMVPGWIRERVAELLFTDEEGSEDQSILKMILDCLSKLPIDLRPPLISSLLIVGGTASLPGFIPRLRISLLHHLLPPPTPSTDPHPKHPLNTTESRREEASQWKKKSREPYKEIYGLASSLAIINDPSPVDGKSGNGPRWTPGLMGWVGGSLAGALKTSSNEITRESYDTSLSHSIARGEVYKEELDLSSIEISTSLGINIEDLKVGRALGGGDDEDEYGTKRKRGWRDHVVGMDDWTRGAVKV